MGKFFKVIGVVSVISFIGIVAAFGALVVKGVALDRESRTYVLAAIPAIASTWDKRELINRASPELVRKVDAAQWDTLFARFGQLGPIVSFEQPKGQAGVFYSPAGALETASYSCNATFQNGTARLRMMLLRRDGRWMIQGFYLDNGKVTPPNRA